MYRDSGMICGPPAGAPMCCISFFLFLFLSFGSKTSMCVTWKKLLELKKRFQILLVESLKDDWVQICEAPFSKGS